MSLGPQRPNNLPRPLRRMIGREEEVRQIIEQVQDRQIVSIVGPGGFGKSTVAIAAAHQLAEHYRDGAVFIDLGRIDSPGRVPGIMAATLDVRVSGEDALPALLTYFEKKQMLVLLDTCEAQIEAAAALTDAILGHAPAVHFLATSREPLRMPGERVVRLQPLPVPPPESPLTAKDAIEYPSVELLVERASATIRTFALTDADVAAAVRVCARVDGIPLAIELAAAHVATFGLHHLAARLENSFELLPMGRRTAETRHQTLSATIDWSYGLLSPDEQKTLLRLSLFHGRFELDDAVSVVSGPDFDRNDATSCILALIGKSLIAADISTRPASYRLLDMTRSYAAAHFAAQPEGDQVRRRHAVLYERLVRESAGLADDRSAWARRVNAMASDVLAAIEWAFDRREESRLAIALTVNSLLLARLRCLPREFRRWEERALDLMREDGVNDPAAESKLRLDLGDLIYLTEGISASLAQTVEAHEQQDAADDGSITHAATTILARWSLVIRSGFYAEALELAHRLLAIAVDSGAEEYILLARRVLAQSLHFSGDHQNARAVAREVLASPLATIPMSPLDRRVSMGIVLSRSAWLEGFPDRAAEISREAVAVAETFDAGSVCQSLAFSACPIAIWRGDLKAARSHIERLRSHAAANHLNYWASWGSHLHACLWHLDNPMEAVAGAGLHASQAAPDRVQAEHLATMSVAYASQDLIPATSPEQPAWYSAEAIRVFAESPEKADAPPAEREALFHRALRIAEEQNALSWELRIAMSLARLLRGERKTVEARRLLASRLDRFTEGFTTADLIAGAALLRELRTEG